MSDEQVKQEVIPSVAEVATGQAELDVNKLDLSNVEALPEDIKNLKTFMPTFGVKRPLWKVLMSGVFTFPKPKPSKSWFNGKLLSKEEYAALPVEETFAYRNKITKAKK